MTINAAFAKIKGKFLNFFDIFLNILQLNSKKEFNLGLIVVAVFLDRFATRVRAGLYKEKYHCFGKAIYPHLFLIITLSFVSSRLCGSAISWNGVLPTFSFCCTTKMVTFSGFDLRHFSS